MATDSMPATSNSPDAAQIAAWDRIASAERAYRRAAWSCSQLLRTRLAVPLEELARMADEIRELPHRDGVARDEIAGAISRQARELQVLVHEARRTAS